MRTNVKVILITKNIFKKFYILFFEIYLYVCQTLNHNTMPEHIFNIREIAKRVPNKAKVPNRYFRLNQTFTSKHDFVKSPELLDEVASVIKKDTAAILRMIRDMKYQAKLKQRQEAEVKSPKSA